MKINNEKIMNGHVHDCDYEYHVERGEMPKSAPNDSNKRAPKTHLYQEPSKEEVCCIFLV